MLDALASLEIHIGVSQSVTNSVYQVYQVYQVYLRGSGPITLRGLGLLFRLLPDQNDLVWLGGPEAMYNMEGNKATFVYRLKFSLAITRRVEVEMMFNSVYNVCYLVWKSQLGLPDAEDMTDPLRHVRNKTNKGC